MTPERAGRGLVADKLRVASRAGIRRGESRGGPTRFAHAIVLAGALLAAGIARATDPSSAGTTAAAPAGENRPGEARAKGPIGLEADGAAKGGSADPSLPFTHHALPNGLKVLSLEDHSVPSLTYWTWVRVGSIHERPGITGISHLFEHLMFRGAKRYGPGEFDRLLELNGGESNAFTDKDMTAYYEDIVSDQLPLVVDLDSDRLASLDVTAEVLGPERDVVKEERRLRAENNVVGALDETLEAAAYHAHPYGWPVLGWMGDLDNITVEDCREFFRTHYAPNNATLIVVGDFDTPALHALVEKSYASIAQQPAIRPVPNSEPSQRGQRRLTLRKEAQVESFAVAYHVPPAGGAGFYALEVLQYILGSGRSSRLYRRLVYDSQAAQSVVAFNGWNKHPSLFKVFVDMRPGRTAVEGEMMLEEEIGRLVTGGVEERELQKAKNNIRASFIRQLKTNNGKGQVAGQFELLWGDWAAHARFLAQIDAVTREEVAKAARTFLAEDNKTIVLLVPPAQAKEDGEGPEGEEGVEGGPGRKAGEAEAVGAGRSAGKGGEE